MSKISQLEKGEPIYPVTVAGAVSFLDGKTAEEKVEELKSPDKLSGTAYTVIAEHITRLNKKIERLEEQIDNANNLRARSVDSATGYYINGDKTVIIGSGAPTMVPAFAGQFYINTSGPALYYAVNNSATTDWKQA